MSCLSSIVTLGLCGDAGTPTSGLTLVMAAGISTNNLANIANEDVISGAELALQQKELSLVQVRNDFIGALQTNNVVTDVNSPVYDSAFFLPATSVGVNTDRGIWLHKSAKYKGSLRKTYIKAIQLYPLGTGDGVLTIYDGINEYSYDVSLVANQVNTFDADSLSGFPFEIDTNSASVKVLVTSTVAFASSKITCKTGCNGTMPNPCGWAEGWNGATQVREEGYGVNVQFYCECDYTQILCNLSKSYAGELIWWKWQANIFREHQKSNRFNNWVVYNHAEMDKWIADAEANYNRVWNNLMSGMLGILNTYRDDCLSCRNVRWRTNI
jgi:hypothetical protein